MKVLEAYNLSKIYRSKKIEKGIINLLHPNYEEKLALDNFNIELNENEVIGILGRNGAGKTTIIKLLCGILNPDSGKINILNSKDKQFINSNISLILGHKPQMDLDISVLDNFKLHQVIYEIDDFDFNQILMELIDIFEINLLLNNQVRTLSLGERIKCEIVMELLHRPKIIFLDEPTLGLDLVVQDKIYIYLKKYIAKYQASIVLTSHNTRDIQNLCDKIIFIDHGKTIFSGTLLEFSKRFNDKVYLEIKYFDIYDYQKLNNYLINGEMISNNYFKIILLKAEVDIVKKELSSYGLVEEVKVYDLAIEDIIKEYFKLSYDKE